MAYCLDYLNEDSKKELTQHIEANHIIGSVLSYHPVSNGTILPEKLTQWKMLGDVVDAARNYVELSAFHEG